MRIDLHVHATASDGLLDSPAQIHAVKEAGIQVLGLADDDTVDGIRETRALAEAAGWVICTLPHGAKGMEHRAMDTGHGSAEVGSQRPTGSKG